MPTLIDYHQNTVVKQMHKDDRSRAPGLLIKHAPVTFRSVQRLSVLTHANKHVAHVSVRGDYPRALIFRMTDETATPTSTHGLVMQDLSTLVPLMDHLAT